MHFGTPRPHITTVTDVTFAERAAALDEADPLAAFRNEFVITDPDLCYLDGNSLGRIPRATVGAVNDLMNKGWGEGLVTGWSNWIDMAQRVGDQLGRATLGAAPGQVLVTDTTSVNLYRLAIAALNRHPDRRTIVIDAANFPTDRYIFEGIAQDRGLNLVVIPNEDPSVAPQERITPEILRTYLSDDVALVCLQVINYRSGARQPVEALTSLAREFGTFVLWDASHAVGALDLQFDAWGVDLAVGCTYKYLNSGPGSPAWLYIAHDQQDGLRTPIDGWFAQADQFAMGQGFDRAPGIRGFQIASPSIMGLTCVETSLTIVERAGMSAIEHKCAVGTSLMVDMWQEWLEPLGFGLDTPTDPHLRGGHLSLTHEDAAQIAAAMRVVSNVIPDFRKPHVIRVAGAPLYTSYSELVEGFNRLKHLVKSKAYVKVQLGEGRVT